MCDKKCRSTNKILHNTSFKSENDLIKIWLSFYCISVLRRLDYKKGRKNHTSLNVSKKTEQLIEEHKL